MRSHVPKAKVRQRGCLARIEPLIWRQCLWTRKVAAVPDQPTPEDDESTSVTQTHKGLSKKTAIIGVVFAAAATGMFIKLAKGRGVAEDLETGESSIGGTPTSPEGEFDAIVRAVAATIGEIKIVSTDGFNVEAKVRTNSGKGAWTADFTFDPETGYYNYRHPYPDAGTPRVFGDEVGRRIREAASD
jgi:hypothetical protein